MRPRIKIIHDHTTNDSNTSLFFEDNTGNGNAIFLPQLHAIDYNTRTDTYEVSDHSSHKKPVDPASLMCYSGLVERAQSNDLINNQPDTFEYIPRKPSGTLGPDNPYQWLGLADEHSNKDTPLSDWDSKKNTMILEVQSIDCTTTQDLNP